MTVAFDFRPVLVPASFWPMNPVRLGLLASLVLGTVVYAKDLTIAVIPKGTTHEFWKSVHAGAVKAERELTAAGTPVKLFWKGPLREIGRASCRERVCLYV